MKRFVLLIVLVLAFLLINSYKTKTYNLLIGSYYFSSEIAKTESEKEIGLAKYNKIENDFAMAFPFDTRERQAFWMKNMKFPIDIIYVDNGKIIQIFKNVPFPKNHDDVLPIYRPDSNSNLVVEINAGLSDKYKLKKGDVVKLQ